MNLRLIQSDGLEKVPKCVDEVVVAGLGGLLIEKIILGCSWLKDLNIPLVLQPQSFSVSLKKQLALHGFEVEKEIFVVEKNKPYRVMLLKFTGIRRVLSLKNAVVSNLSRSSGQVCEFLKLKRECSMQILSLLANANRNSLIELKRFYYEEKIKVLDDLLCELEL